MKEIWGLRMSILFTLMPMLSTTAITSESPCGPGKNRREDTDDYCKDADYDVDFIVC